MVVIVISKIYLNWVWKDESACYGFNLKKLLNSRAFRLGPLENKPLNL